MSEFLRTNPNYKKPEDHKFESLEQLQAWAKGNITNPSTLKAVLAPKKEKNTEFAKPGNLLDVDTLAEVALTK